MCVCGGGRQTADSWDSGSWLSEFCRGCKRPGRTGLVVLSLKTSAGITPSSEDGLSLSGLQQVG